MRTAPAGAASRIAFHPPCTLQHTQKLRGITESLLAALGAELLPVADAHLCCGAAGTYTVLQPELSTRLRADKLEKLQRARPDLILSANIGCLAHLETGTRVPVRHWIEWVDARLARRSRDAAAAVAARGDERPASVGVNAGSESMRTP